LKKANSEEGQSPHEAVKPKMMMMVVVVVVVVVYW
jgi:hypothetical protein